MLSICRRGLVVATFLALLSPGLLAQSVGETVVSEPVYPYIVNMDLRALPKPTAWRPGDPIKDIPRITRPIDPANTTFVQQMDPLMTLQERGASDALFANPLLNIGGQPNTGVSVPDTVGDVGVDYYIQAVNSTFGSQYTVYNKSDGSVAAGPFAIDIQGNGLCADGTGDPIVLYDQHAGRWLITEFADRSSTVMCVYLSPEDDLLNGDWVFYEFNSLNFPDYPKYGIWSDAYYVTSNEASPRVHALDRQAMINGQPATMITTTLSRLGSFNFDALTPADLDGETLPPKGSPGIFMRHRDREAHNGDNDLTTDILEVFEYTVDFSEGTATLEQTDITVADFDSALCGLTGFNCVPQPFSSFLLDPVREVIMNRLTYRNFRSYEMLLGNFTIDVTGTDVAGIRWFELRREPGGQFELYQEGTFNPDGEINRWMAAMAMDRQGNIAMAYNVSNNAVFPGLSYTGRKAGDPLGTMPEGEHVLIEGLSPNNNNRYGDYAAMNIDPVDDCTFWFTGEHNQSTIWSTQIASFRFSDCLECIEGPPTLEAANNGDNAVLLTWNPVPGASTYEIFRARDACPQTNPERIAEVSGTSYNDTTVSGDLVYSYQIRAVLPADNCVTGLSNCTTVTATGICREPPAFAGLTSAMTIPGEGCAITLAWEAAVGNCVPDVVYNIYRDQDPNFTPSPANRLAQGVVGLTYEDNSALSGERYTYIVRAEDTSGVGSGPNDSNEDGNLKRVNAAAFGPVIVRIDDDFEEEDPVWTTFTGPTDEASSPFSRTTFDTNGNGFSYFCPNSAITTDQSLVLNLTIASPSELTFFHKAETEVGWDGGVLEYSSDGGATWFDINQGDGKQIPINPGRITTGGYNRTLESGTSNPLSGRPAWTGIADYIPAVIDLTDFIGSEVRFRWRMGADNEVGSNGWFIDDVVIRVTTDCDSVLCTMVTDFYPLWPERSVLDMLQCPEFTR